MLTAIEAIDKARVQALDKLTTGFHNLSDEFTSDVYWCPAFGAGRSYECECMLLGALTKAMAKAGIQNAKAPYDGQSFVELCKQMIEIKPPVWYQEGGGGYHRNKHPCSLKAPIAKVVEEVGKSIEGLKLADFDTRR